MCSLIAIGRFQQHLRIKRFYGRSEDAVETQVWIAVSVYVLSAIVNKNLEQDASLPTLLPMLWVTLLQNASLQPTLAEPATDQSRHDSAHRLSLFKS